jgi:hypothetical protein
MVAYRLVFIAGLPIWWYAAGILVASGGIYFVTPLTSHRSFN